MDKQSDFPNTLNTNPVLEDFQTPSNIKIAQSDTEMKKNEDVLTIETVQQVNIFF